MFHNANDWHATYPLATHEGLAQINSRYKGGGEMTVSSYKIVCEAAFLKHQIASDIYQIVQ